MPLSVTVLLFATSLVSKVAPLLLTVTTSLPTRPTRVPTELMLAVVLPLYTLLAAAESTSVRALGLTVSVPVPDTTL